MFEVYLNDKRDLLVVREGSRTAYWRAREMAGVIHLYDLILFTETMRPYPRKTVAFYGANGSAGSDAPTSG